MQIFGTRHNLFSEIFKKFLEPQKYFVFLMATQINITKNLQVHLHFFADIKCEAFMAFQAKKWG